MQETFNQSISIFVALIVVSRTSLARFKCKDNSTFPDISFGSIFVTFAAVRASWGPLLAPIFLLQGANSGWRRRIIISFVVLLSSIVFIRYLYSPVTNKGQIGLILEFFSTLNLEVLLKFLSNIKNNFALFLGMGKNSNPIEIFLRYEFIAITLYLGFLTYSKRLVIASTEAELQITKVSLLFIVVSLLLVISLYEVGSWRDYRVLAPSFICVFLLMACTRKRSIFLLIILAAQLATLPFFLPTLKDFRTNNFLGFSAKENDLVKTINTSIVYAPNKNRWCNTLLMFSTSEQDNRLYRSLWLVNAGIGISTVHNFEKLSFPLRSKYVFLTEGGLNLLVGRGFQKHDLIPHVNLGSIGVIYENLASNCSS